MTNNIFISMLKMRRKYLNRIIYSFFIIILPIILSIFSRNVIVSYSVVFFVLAIFTIIKIVLTKNSLIDEKTPLNKQHLFNEGFNDVSNDIKILKNDINILKGDIRYHRRLLRKKSNEKTTNEGNITNLPPQVRSKFSQYYLDKSQRITGIPTNVFGRKIVSSSSKGRSKK